MPRSSSSRSGPEPGDVRAGTPAIAARAGGDPGPADPPAPRTGRLPAASLLVGLAGLAAMLATEPRMAIGWDEGYTLGREARVRAWLRAVRDPAGFAASWSPPGRDEDLVQQVGAPPPRPDQVDSRAELLLDPRVLAYFWPFAREEPHGHPSFYAILGLAGDVLAPGWRDLPRARLGPILLFCATGALLFHALGRRWGAWPAAAAAGAWFLQPNLFGHAHYAAYDAVLTSLWALAALAFARASDEPPAGGRDRGGALAAAGFGVILGCGLATKFTGWFLPLPLAAWAAWARPRRGFRTFLIGVPIALLVLYAVMPPWWVEPIAGPIRFLQSNLTREDTTRIPVLFLGRPYLTPKQSLPPYNTLAWTAMVTPVLFLSLAALGLSRAVRSGRGEPIAGLFLVNWLFLMALRSLPHTPGHDGVRLFLPAFGMLAPLAGAGALQLERWLGPRARIAVLAALGEGVASVALLMPVPLSYYSPLVGGLPGATRLGMEPTYYWDALDGRALAWLRERTAPGQTIHFSTNPTSWLYLRRIGELPPRLSGVDPGVPAWYVVQNRPGMNDLQGIPRLLMERAEPAFEVRKFGVPLIAIYPAREVQRVQSIPAAGGGPGQRK
ncbi:hypothetical protein OJF2_43700 [Aquisphaera giovannonii]|uniref:Glycosyltransferase RgtA/B/C/D-like domain-containing protein n=1 Tax=Aquisphaera giovannonii TaxID=406548 RepID=A0A5B9W5E6_9BACT|nr:glycosyltransferase family 39 protein [Aquisphaera giovannonii]QEH35813.1 hypothetical protein OJF2_43700 [Aquisphaera giovannonii]